MDGSLLDVFYPSVIRRTRRAWGRRPRALRPPRRRPASGCPRSPQPPGARGREGGPLTLGSRGHGSGPGRRPGGGGSEASGVGNKRCPRRGVAAPTSGASSAAGRTWSPGGHCPRAAPLPPAGEGPREGPRGGPAGRPGGRLALVPEGGRQEPRSLAPGSRGAGKPGLRGCGAAGSTCLRPP